MVDQSRLEIVCLFIPGGTATPQFLADYCEGFRRLGHVVHVTSVAEVLQAMYYGVLPALLSDKAFVFSYDYWTFYPYVRGQSIIGSPFETHSSGDILSVFHAVGARTVALFGDDPFYPFGSLERPAYHFGEQLASELNMSFVYDENSVQDMRNAGFSRCEFLPHGFNAQRFAGAGFDESKECEVCFVGNFTDRRATFLREVAGFDLAIYGPETWLDDRILRSAYRGRSDPFDDTPTIYRSAAISLDIKSRGESGLSQRVFDVWGAGGFLLSEESTGKRASSVEKELLVTFRTPQDMVERVSYFMDNPTERLAVAERSKRLVLEHHGSEGRARQVLDCLSKAGFL